MSNEVRCILDKDGNAALGDQLVGVLIEILLFSIILRIHPDRDRFKLVYTHKKNQILTAIRWFHGNFQVPKKKKKVFDADSFPFFFFEREKAKREETFILY